MAVIFLTGMMGSGKSAVGEALARRLGAPFLDVDRMVEDRAGKPVALVFADEGEAAFRRLERAALEAIPAKTACVVATGGGAVMDPANRGTMKAKGVIIHLRVDVDEALRRIGETGDRPLLAGGEPRARWLEIVAARAAAYAAADAAFETTGRSAEEAAAEIESWLRAGGYP
jgi:shikimate kinase